MILYEKDFYEWANEQASILRAGNFTALDIDNLIEEIEGMAKSEQRELKSRLIILLAHLLKWKYQPSKRVYGHSWEGTIGSQRIQIQSHLKENPSLKYRLDDVFASAYDAARWDAMSETGLPINIFPTQCLWTFEQIMDSEFWPN